MVVIAVSILPKFGKVEDRRLSEGLVERSEKPSGSLASTRTRRKHNKVRSGCLTCKVRRKKCDETKPSCRRCTETGRQCDGYEMVSKPTSQNHQDSAGSKTRPLARRKPVSSGSCGQNFAEKRQPVALAINSTIARSPSSFSDFGAAFQISDLERHCFTFYQHRTGRQFAAYFDSTLWRDYSNYLALTHPVAFACVAAVGAVHRRFLLGISSEAFEYCALADKLYKKAATLVRRLQKQLRIDDGSECSSLERDVVMCSQFFLGLFESFQGNLDRCVTRMDEAMRYLLNRPMTLVHRESKYVNVDEAEDLYADIIRQMHIKTAEAFGSPHKILARLSLMEPLPDMPLHFESLEQGRDLLFTELEWIMSTPGSVWSVPHLYKAAQKMHVTRLLRWSVAYANTVEHSNRTHKEKVACMLMKQTRNATFLLLYLTLYVYAEQHVRDWMDDWDNCEAFDQGLWPDTTKALFETQDWQIQYMPITASGRRNPSKFRDGLEVDNNMLWTAVLQRQELLSKLQCVKVLTEAKLDDNSPFHYLEHSVSFDSGVGPPRSSVIEPASSAKTRHQVQSMLRQPKTEEEDWSWLGIYGIAEQLSAIEEHAVATAARSKLPPDINPRWVDFSYFAEGRRLLLRYCHPDETGLGMKWTQEWWTFS